MAQDILPSAFDLAGHIQTDIASVVSLLTTSIGSIATVVTTTVTSLLSAGKAIVDVARTTIDAVVTIVKTVGNAIRSTIAAVVSVGSALGTAITTALTSAVTSVGQIMHALGAVPLTVLSVAVRLSAAVAQISGVVTQVIGGLSAVGTVVGTVLGVLVGFVSGVGAILGAVASVVSGLMSAATSVVSALTSTVGSISQALGGIVSSVGAVLGAFGQTVQAALQTLLQFSHDVSGIHAQTGMGWGASVQLANEFRSVGVSSGETAKIFGAREMAPDLFNSRARSVGAPTLQDPDFIVKQAQWFQHEASTGIGGFLAARAKLDALYGGQAPESVLRLANQNPMALQQNLDYGRSLQKDLGVGPGAVQATNDLSLLMDRVGMFVSMIQERFASDLLPALQAGFSIVTDFFRNNAGTISDALQSAAYAIFVDGPTLAIAGARTVLDWGQGLADIFFAVAQAAVGLLRALGNRDGALYQVLHVGATFLDGLLEFGAQFQSVMVGIGAGIQHAWYLLTGLGHDVDPGKAQQDAYNNSPLHLQTSISDSLDATLVRHKKDILNTADSLERSLSNDQAMFNDGLRRARGGVDKIDTMAGSPDHRAAMFVAAHETNTRTTEAASASVSTGNPQLDRMIDLLAQMLGLNRDQLDQLKYQSATNPTLDRMGAYIAEDAFRKTLR